jgi:hypothetical protein
MPEEIPAVRPELLIKANEKAAADHEAHGSSNPLIVIITALDGEATSEEMLAVSYRLQALAAVLKEGEGGPWKLNVKGKEYTLVNETLFRAAAKTPLHIAGTVGEVRFNREEFMRVALEEGESEGRA